MNKKYLMFMLASMFLMSANAQEEKPLGKTDEKYSVLTNRFGANWYITGNIGGQITFADDEGEGKFGKRIAPALHIGIGKWFTPGMGIRLMYSGLSSKGFGQAGDSYISGKPDANGFYKQKFNYMNIHADAMFNLSNLFCGYNEKRVYNAIPYVGLGMVRRLEKDNNGQKNLHLGVNTGLVNRFCVAKAWDVNLEIGALIMRDEFDSKRAGKKTDAVLSISAGVTYNFAPRGFSKAIVRTTGISQAEMDAIRNDLNEQLAKNKALEKELAQEKSRNAVVKEDPKQVVVAETTPRLIFFSINKATIAPREKVNVRYMAEQMKANPDRKFTITGYADNSTGSAEFNQKLTQKRAEAVYNMLVDEFGVNPSQLTVEAKGGVDNMYESASLNRVVIVK